MSASAGKVLFFAIATVAVALAMIVFASPGSWETTTIGPASERGVWLDFLLIPSYGFLLIHLAMLVRHNPEAWKRMLGTATMIAAAAAMGADGIENFGILQMLRDSTGPQWLAPVSVVKWVAAGSAMLGAAAVLHIPLPAAKLASVLFALSGALCLWGAVSPAVLPYSLASLAVGVPLVILLFGPWRARTLDAMAR